MKKRITPVQTLSLGYVAVILFGTILLWLPFSSVNYQYSSFVDALFTSASAVSTTGLVVVDTGSYYSKFGQVVIITLVQVGGLGYMIFFAFISLSVGYRFTINGKRLLNESIARPTTIDLKRFTKSVILFTAFFEFIGAVVFIFIFLKRYPLAESVYSAVFHSISAFCTAGFSLYSDSFTFYANDFLTNLIIAIITIAGGIGFFVLHDVSQYIVDIFKRKHPTRLTDHSKLVLLVTASLIVGGSFFLILTADTNLNFNSLDSKIYASTFQAISASTTTGFNSVDIGSMNAISLLCVVFLMFIGASPGGTGGGIKTSTFGIILLFVKKVIGNRDEICVFNRRVSLSVVEKAIAITILAAVYLLFVVIVLAVSERISIFQLLFEATSALGTVGLSMGITSNLSPLGKILIIITMLVGRIGPLAIGYSLIGKPQIKRYYYPKGNVVVG